ncbi:beta-agarase [Rhodanobacter sp. C06]|uniref:beta-galactosidase n=1 Tax=Rhodanobacter sp. C06 TaxID=1945854 RepID=UPI0009878A56|nr:beta-galactosidase [Rhodanobacter sp. C06]OOG38460.1 beta-agarase [Rhodanobacter sp. C06]
MKRVWLFAVAALFAGHLMAAEVADLAAASTRPDLQHVVRAAATETARDGVKQQRYTFQPGAQPQIVVRPAQGAWNWQGQGELRLRVQNAMPWAVTLVVDIDGADAKQHLHAVVDLPAGPAQTLAVPLRAVSPLAFGMQAGPTRPFDDGGGRLLVATTVEGKLDLSAVRDVRLAMPAPQAAQAILFGRMDVLPGEAALHDAYAGIVDRYGQSTREDWPEKVADDAALRAAVKQAPPVASASGEDRYGGRMDVRLQKTGWFHAQKADGRWWLVTPDGHGFFSLGVNTVKADDTRTYVQGRASMFRDLPADGGVWAAFYGAGDNRNAQQGAGAGRCCDHGQWFDFYAANLYRVDGKGWLTAWRARTLVRLKGWGFNTIANWSDPALGAMHQLPYTRELDIRGEFGNVATGYDWWGRMPDPFDPRFAQAADAAAAKAAQGVRNDPWLLGYFADNELSWAAYGPQGRWALAVGTLHGEASSDAKQAFITELKKEYGAPDKLAAAWGIALSSWSALDAANFPAPAPSEAHPAIAADYSVWLTRYAERFFRIVAAAIRRHDPHHLYLGSRFAVSTPEAIAACARYCDVVSFNIYADEPQHGFDAAAMRRLDKPVIISEFHFGSGDCGPFGKGVVSVWNEAQRGPAYARYLQAAASDPDIVGAHWFEYVDEPVTGRLLDGENGHFGLVGITDIPFAGFVETVRKTNQQLRHAAAH